MSLILEVPQPAPWPECSGTVPPLPEIDLPPPLLDPDGDTALPAIEPATFIVPAIVETLVLVANFGDRGLPGPRQIYNLGSSPTPIPGYTLLWLKAADPPTDPDDRELVLIE